MVYLLFSEKPTGLVRVGYLLGYFLFFHMIRNSFLLLPRIGCLAEQRIWEQGILCWDDFIKMRFVHGISAKTKLAYDRMLHKAAQALLEDDSSFFNMLKKKHAWRLYPDFRDITVFLDIEVSGVRAYDDITMIGLYDGERTMTMIRGINLDISALRAVLARYKLIVTYNGSSFDLPFLRKRYPGLLPNVPEIDLRHLCNNIGLSGGLKEVEKSLGIKRSEIVEKIYGGDPKLLWKRYHATGDQYYLKLLVEYNEEDCVNLQNLADFAVKMQKHIISMFFSLNNEVRDPQALRLPPALGPAAGNRRRA